MKHPWKQEVYAHGGSRIWRDEENGGRALVADTYQPGDAPLFMALPLLLKACKAALDDSTAGYERHGLSAETTALLQAAIYAAEGPGKEKKQ